MQPREPTVETGEATPYDSIAFSRYKIARMTNNTITINNILLTELRWIAASAPAVRATQRGKARPRADSLTPRCRPFTVAFSAVASRLYRHQPNPVSRP